MGDTEAMEAVLEEDRLSSTTVTDVDVMKNTSGMSSNRGAGSGGGVSPLVEHTTNAHSLQHSETTTYRYMNTDKDCEKLRIACIIPHDSIITGNSCIVVLFDNIVTSILDKEAV